MGFVSILSTTILDEWMEREESIKGGGENRRMKESYSE